MEHQSDVVNIGKPNAINLPFPDGSKTPDVWWAAPWIQCGQPLWETVMDWLNPGTTFWLCLGMGSTTLW
jgi:hypothetical protein